MQKKTRYYAVVRGRKPGIYNAWHGDDKALSQVCFFKSALYKGFNTLEEAEEFMLMHKKEAASLKKAPLSNYDLPFFTEEGREKKPEKKKRDLKGRISIYSDGSAINNPGPGGYGTIIVWPDGRREELSLGFSRTTNNRMELMGAIAGLEFIKDEENPVLIVSDSRYLVDGIEKGWARKWRSRGWRKSDGAPALNTDLWKCLLELLEKREFTFKWVKGHDGHIENERCDDLAQRAARGNELREDKAYLLSLKK